MNDIIQDPFSDDASSCCSAHSGTTTKPSVSLKSQATSTQPSFDPIRTPISMPPRFLNSTTTTAHLRVKSPEETEEIVTSAFVHAACRLHEATAVVTAVCNHLIFQWSGLLPSEAATAAAVVALRLPDTETPIDKRRETLKAANTGLLKPMQYDAMVLQTLLTSARVPVMIAGVMAGKALDAREFALAQNTVLPLSAFQDGDDKKSAQTAATLAAFTNPMPTRCDIGYIKKGLWDATCCARLTAKLVSNKQVKSHLSDLRKHENQMLESFEKFKSLFSSINTNSSDAEYHVRSRIHDAVYMAYFSAEQLQQLVVMAYAVATDRRSWETQPKHATSQVLLYKTQTIGEDDLLKQAREACQQATMAIHTVRHSIGNPDLLATLRT